MTDRGEAEVEPSAAEIAAAVEIVAEVARTSERLPAERRVRLYRRIAEVAREMGEGYEGIAEAADGIVREALRELESERGE